jgi:hypothetical protein
MSENNHRIFSNQHFYGGQSSDEAIGTEASFSYSRAMDHRRNPSQLTVLPGPREIGQGVVQDLILNIVQAQNGTRYAYGDQGNVYRINTDNTVNYLNKFTTGSDGCLYRSDSDAVYFATQTDVRRYYPISATPTFDQTYGPSKSVDTAATRTGGANTYTVPLAIDEGQSCTFQPDIEPFYSMKVKVVTKGTGTMTLTLHDGLNNTLSTKTLTNAEVSGGQVEFVFPAQVRALVKPNARTYHYHLTSSVADTTVACSTAGSLSTADYELWASRLVDTVNNFHPMAQFLQYTCIGNGNYLAVWEPLSDSNPSNSEFQRHRLVFPSGFEVCGLAVTDEFLVIACEKRSTDGTKDFQEGKLFTWDGVARTYNQVVDVSGGSPEGMYTHENYPFFFVNGTLCAWPGGKNIVKVRTVANTDTMFTSTIDNTHVYPNMLTVRDNMLHAGYPSITTNSAIEHGVYIWGSLEKNYASSFNYGYVPSSMQTTPTGTSLQMGCVVNFGDELYMSWKASNSSYGLDIVDSICKPAPVAKWRSRRFDAGATYKKKLAASTQVNTAVLPPGVTITPTYRIDNDTEVVQTEAAKTEGKDEVQATILKDFKRIVYGFDVACEGEELVNSPVIYADSLKWDPYSDRGTI